MEMCRWATTLAEESREVWVFPYWSSQYVWVYLILIVRELLFRERPHSDINAHCLLFSCTGCISLTTEKDKSKQRNCFFQSLHSVTGTETPSKQRIGSNGYALKTQTKINITCCRDVLPGGRQVKSMSTDCIQTLFSWIISLTSLIFK